MAVDLIARGIAASKASLVDGKIPASQLPSYVDDVVEYDSVKKFPKVGEEGKIYVAKDTNSTYRWSGTQYIEISVGGLAEKLTKLIENEATDRADSDNNLASAIAQEATDRKDADDTMLASAKSYTDTKTKAVQEEVDKINVKIPSCPTTANGTFILQATVTNGTVSYQWVSGAAIKIVE